MLCASLPVLRPNILLISRLAYRGPIRTDSCQSRTFTALSLSLSPFVLALQAAVRPDSELETHLVSPLISKQ